MTEDKDNLLSVIIGKRPGTDNPSSAIWPFNLSCRDAKTGVEIENVVAIDIRARYDELVTATLEIAAVQIDELSAGCEIFCQLQPYHLKVSYVINGEIYELKPKPKPKLKRD